MIFDAEHVENLIKEYQLTKESDILNDVLTGCDALINAIIISRGYPPHMQDDMKQECRRKILNGVRNYKPTHDPARLHKYLTSIILNACKTASQKDFKVQSLEDDTLPIEDHQLVNDYAGDSTHDVTTIIARNRHRFPSIDTDTIDAMTYEIVTHLMSGEKNSRVVRAITRKYKVTNEISKAVFFSTMAYLRFTHFKSCTKPTSPDEFSIYADLYDLFGQETYERIVSTFDTIMLKITG